MAKAIEGRGVHADAATLMAGARREPVRWAREGGAPAPKPNSHAPIPMRRTLCAELPEFEQYARLSKPRRDGLLSRSDPEAFGFIDEMCGGAPSASALAAGGADGAAS